MRDSTLVSAKDTIATAKPPIRTGTRSSTADATATRSRKALRQRARAPARRARAARSKHADDDRGADHGDQDAGHPLDALQEQYDRASVADADRERRPVRLAAQRSPCRSPTGSRSGPSLSIEKPNSFGSWLISTVSAMPFM